MRKRATRIKVKESQSPSTCSRPRFTTYFYPRSIRWEGEPASHPLPPFYPLWTSQQLQFYLQFQRRRISRAISRILPRLDMEPHSHYTDKADTIHMRTKGHMDQLRAKSERCFLTRKGQPGIKHYNKTDDSNKLTRSPPSPSFFSFSFSFLTCHT